MNRPIFRFDYIRPYSWGLYTVGKCNLEKIRSWKNPFMLESFERTLDKFNWKQLPDFNRNFPTLFKIFSSTQLNGSHVWRF